MEEVRKLEQMILNGEGDILKQSERVDEWIAHIIKKKWKNNFPTFSRLGYKFL